MRTAAASTNRPRPAAGRWKRADLPSRRIVALVDAHGPAAWEYLTGHVGVPAKVARAAIARDVRRGLLDYGVSIGRPWVTDAGRALISPASATS